MQLWDARRYDRFEKERERPARDLIARIPLRAPGSILDIGCGSGLSTQALKRAFPSALIMGIDNSPDMIAAARKRVRNVDFGVADAAQIHATGADLVFANAVFHWIPDHLALLARLASELRKGAVLAFQMPDNEDEPSHRLMREVAARPGFEAAAAQAGAARAKIGSFADYDAALSPPCEDVDLWRTTYAHRLGSPDDVVKWVEGAGLRPFLDALDEAARAAFVEAYAREIARAYPPTPNGAVIFPFPRLFGVAVRG